MQLLIEVFLVTIASLVIAKACNGFEAATDYLGRNMSDGMKGALLNAIGSSMPELVVTAIYLFVYCDTTGFAGGIGTTAGSAIFNAAVIPALVILVVLIKAPLTTIKVSKKVILRDGLTLISAELFLILFLGDTLHWGHGLALMGIYCAYAGWMIFRNRFHESNDYGTQTPNRGQGSRFTSFVKLDLEYTVLGNKNITTSNAISLLLVAVCFITAACWQLVHSCESIGTALGLHGYFIAVILAAGASSIPDTILSVKDAKKGNYDDAIANALGSNIFDICFALGLPLFVFTLINGPITMDVSTVSHVAELRVLLLLLTVCIFFVLLFSKRLTLFTASILLGVYALFTLYVIGRAYEWESMTAVANILHSIKPIL